MPINKPGRKVIRGEFFAKGTRRDAVRVNAPLNFFGVMQKSRVLELLYSHFYKAKHL